MLSWLHRYVPKLDVPTIFTIAWDIFCLHFFPLAFFLQLLVISAPCCKSASTALTLSAITAYNEI